VHSSVCQQLSQTPGYAAAFPVMRLGTPSSTRRPSSNQPATGSVAAPVEMTRAPCSRSVVVRCGGDCNTGNTRGAETRVRRAPSCWTPSSFQHHTSPQREGYVTPVKTWRPRSTATSQRARLKVELEVKIDQKSYLSGQNRRTPRMTSALFACSGRPGHDRSMPRQAQPLRRNAGGRDRNSLSCHVATRP
jgi:hypothetical protein